MRLFREAWNPEYIRRNTIIQIVIVTLAFIMLVRIWPCGLVKTHIHSRQGVITRNAPDMLAGDVFTSGDKKLQTVSFTNEHLYRIRLYLNCTMDADAKGAERILFRLYDDGFSCIYEEDIDSRKIEENGFLTATPDTDVEPGKLYYYEILIPEESSAVYVLPVAGRDASAQPENGTLYIDGIYHDEVSLIADFDYSKPLTAVRMILYAGLIPAAAALVYFLVISAAGLCDKKSGGYGGAVGRYFRIGVSIPVFLSAASVLIFSVILNKFGGEIWDRLFFLAGITAAAAWLAAAVWLPERRPIQKKTSRVTAGRRISSIWRNYIQTVSFGLLFYALCQYVNADRNFYHYTNTRWMLIFLAIAFLMNYNEKQFMNKLNAAWLVPGLAGSVLYCRGFEPGTNDLLLARLTCGVIIAWGILLLTVLIHFKIPSGMSAGAAAEYIKTHKSDAATVILWLVFCVFMYRYRFEKIWVFTATLPFLTLFFIKMTDIGRSRFLRNFTNGIFLSLGFVMLFCLHHRPHHYWMLYRYGGIFHTVASTGMYLAVVLGAAVGKLYGKLRDRENMFVRCRMEYFVAGCTVGLILLTMSRTAFLTSAVTVFSVTALTAVMYRKGIMRIIRETVTLAAVCMASFPMVFTAVRMVPAVINDPIRYDIEFQDENFMIYKGDPIDSDKYMTVRRFFATLSGRFRQEAEEEALLPEEEAGGETLLAYAGNHLRDVVAVAATADSDETGSGEDAGRDISNGRFRIFRDYIGTLSIQGHPAMGPPLDNGKEYSHAHNSYLQVAYNFGMIAGVLFIILCVLTLWKAVMLYRKRGDRFCMYAVPFSLIVVFEFVSLTEWAFHPCIPVGFGFILMQAFMMTDITVQPNWE